MYIRPATEEDHRQLAAVATTHARETRNSLALLLEEKHGPIGERNWQEVVAHEITTVSAFVAVEKRTVVAALPYRLDEAKRRAELYALRTDSAYSQEEFELSLLRHALSWLRLHGAQIITASLIAERPAETSIVGLLLRSGFEPGDRFRLLSCDRAGVSSLESTLPNVVVREAKVIELKRLRELGLHEGEITALWIAEVDGEIMSSGRVEFDRTSNAAGGLARLFRLRAAPTAPPEALIALVAGTTRGLTTRGAQVVLAEVAAADDITKMTFQKAGFTELARRVTYSLTIA